MTVFDRLLKLYKTNCIKTPLEDFTTEILTSILASDQLMLDAFVNEILMIEGSRFSINSQEHFISELGVQNCRVDVVIRNESVLCFLENKIHSSEGHQQLIRYNKILEKYADSRFTYLRYCTKFYDKKELICHNFLQLRWQNIAEFLKKWKHVELVKPYLEFLKDHQMNADTSFSATDLVALENMNSLIGKMEIYNQKIKPIFENVFGKAKDVNNFKQIKDHSRFVFIKEFLFGSGYNEIGVGFDFKNAPSVVVWIWCSEHNNHAQLFQDSLTTLISKEGLITNQKDWLGSSAPISFFMGAEDVEHAIEEWFVKSFEIFKNYARSTPQLHWNFPTD
jgi:hypothetical protein